MTPVPERGTWAEFLLPAVALLFSLLTVRGYGYFRDELYYLACAQHLAFGYVDQPPLVSCVTAAARALFGTSLLAIRLLPAVAGAATVWCTARMARDLGGGQFARLTAGAATMLAPAYLSIFGFLSMNAYDVLLWTVCWWLLVRWLRGGDPRLWLAFGAVAGLGLENKISVLFLGFGIAVGLLLAGPRDVFRRRWIWLGGTLALVLFLPHLVWQVLHGWPTLEFMANARREKMTVLPPLVFLREQFLMAGPGALPLWLSGLAYFLCDRRGRVHRAVGCAFVAILALMIVQHAKAYYMAPAYTVLFAGGAVALEGWTRRRGGVALRAAGLGLAIASGILTAPLAKPLLPEDSFVRYAARLGISPELGERHRLGRLPQFFADMHGWPELAETVAEVYRKLPDAERAHACIFGQNYGEAGAIDLFGPKLGLPAAISAHNSYYLWGPRGCGGEVLIVIGDDRETLESLFDHVELGGTFTCRDCMPYENDNPIWIARGLRMPIQQLWPRIKHYI
jgi:dolichyl-phosphate-mannose-protein mannosyltransferase